MPGLSLRQTLSIRLSCGEGQVAQVKTLVFPDSAALVELRCLMKGGVIKHDDGELLRLATFGKRLEVGDDLNLGARPVEFADFEVLVLAKQGKGADEIHTAFGAPACGYLELPARATPKPGVAQAEHQ